MAETRKLKIERLGYLGDGVADGPIYVPGVLPGEVVEGEVTEGKMATPRIIEPSINRVKPLCRHAKSCGGCQLQHVSDDFLSVWKKEVVREALAARGIDAFVLDPLVSSPQSRRRATFSVRRTKNGATAGFHTKASEVIVPVPDCRLVTPALAGSLPLVEALAICGASRKGELSVLVTETETGLDVAATGGKPIDPELRVKLADLARKHDLARIAWGDEVITRRPPVISFDSVDVVPPSGAFLQATETGQKALLSAVLDMVNGATSIVDLFSGCGTFALPLARTAPVHAVEGSASMLAALDQAWRMAKGLKRITHEYRDLFRNPLLPDELSGFCAVVIDPPRAGAEAQVAQIAAARVPRIAHVSCNPVTFARDCETLVAAGYRLGPVQVVDQFRWSTHVELVAGLTLED